MIKHVNLRVAKRSPNRDIRRIVAAFAAGFVHRRNQCRLRRPVNIEPAHFVSDDSSPFFQQLRIDFFHSANDELQVLWDRALAILVHRSHPFVPERRGNPSDGDLLLANLFQEIAKAHRPVTFWKNQCCARR